MELPGCADVEAGGRDDDDDDVEEDCCVSLKVVEDVIDEEEVTLPEIILLVFATINARPASLS